MTFWVILQVLENSRTAVKIYISKETCGLAGSGLEKNPRPKAVPVTKARRYCKSMHGRECFSAFFFPVFVSFFLLFFCVKLEVIAGS